MMRKLVLFGLLATLQAYVPNTCVAQTAPNAATSAKTMPPPPPQSSEVPLTPEQCRSLLATWDNASTELRTLLLSVKTRCDQILR